LIASEYISKQQTLDNFIAVAGNVGSGKTTLLRILEKWLADNIFPFKEPEVENPYLAEQYQAVKTQKANPGVLQSQLYFLSYKGKFLGEISKKASELQKYQHMWLDRTIYEDAEIFFQGLHDRGLVGGRGELLYLNLYEAFLSLTPRPSILFYVKADPAQCMERANKDRRRYESILPPGIEYYEDLHERYESWINEFEFMQKKLSNPTQIVPIDTNNVNLHTLEGQNQVLALIRDTLVDKGLLYENIELPDKVLLPFKPKKS